MTLHKPCSVISNSIFPFFQYFTLPHIVRLDSGHFQRTPVEVRSASGQSLIQCENDRTCMSGRTPPDSGRTLTGLSSFLTNHTSMYPNCSSLSSSLLLLLLSSIHLCYISI